MVVGAMFHVLVPSAVPSAWMKLGSFELAIEPPALSNNLSLPDSHNKYVASAPFSLSTSDGRLSYAVMHECSCDGASSGCRNIYVNSTQIVLITPQRH